MKKEATISDPQSTYFIVTGELDRVLYRQWTYHFLTAFQRHRQVVLSAVHVS